MKYDIINGYNRQTQMTFETEQEAAHQLWLICATDESGLRGTDTFVAVFNDDDTIAYMRRVDDYVWKPERPFRRWLSRKFRDETGADTAT